MRTAVKNAKEATDQALSDLDAYCEGGLLEVPDVATAIALFGRVFVASTRELAESIAHIEGVRL